MSKLLDRFPSSIIVDNVEYQILTDFRCCLECIAALTDVTLTDAEKIDILLYSIDDDIPDNIEQAIIELLKFLSCGVENKSSTLKEKLCDFEQDADYIYSAMLKKGIDLNEVDYMHWWTFISHFSELPESTFRRIVYLRDQRNKGKLTKEEREEINRFGREVIDLIDPQIEHEREELIKQLRG
jgi:hypothetical protein